MDESSHKNVATCNHRHAPHNLVDKYVTKGRNGFWHSFYFTTGNFPDTAYYAEDQEVTEGACRYCYEQITDAIEHGTGENEKEQLRCARCDRQVAQDVRMKTVSSQMTVNEAFSLVGIDTCCGGALPIGEAARRHAVDADNLIAAINSLDYTDEAAEVSMCSL